VSEPRAHPTWKRTAIRWSLAPLLLLLLLLGLAFLIRNDTTNEFHSALDKLSSIELKDRWSHPEMLRIRAMGKEAVPSLQRVLRERSNVTTQMLLWVKTNWPASTTYYSRFPDIRKMSERRWAACQVLQTLGPTGKAALPEVIDCIAGPDGMDANAGSMALSAIGVDALACDHINRVLERGRAGRGRVYLLGALGRVRPPGPRTIHNLIAALKDPLPFVGESSAQTLGQLGVSSPDVILALQNFISASTNSNATLTGLDALWTLQPATASPERVFHLLEHGLQHWVPPPFTKGTSGGQGVGETEQLFMKAAELLCKLRLDSAGKARSLQLLRAGCDKSGRIFVRMLLLPSMMELGLAPEQCFQVCETGLAQPEDYYRLQAARLLNQVCEKHFASDDTFLNRLVRDVDIGVRVYAALIHWRKHHDATIAGPILVDALDRKKHQSYYYDIEILPAAIKGIGALGPNGKDATAALENMTHDPNTKVADAASAALKAVNGSLPNH
jgi:hypothetical protein